MYNLFRKLRAAYDTVIYFLFWRSINRFYTANPHRAYLTELSFREFRRLNPLSERDMKITEAWYEARNRIQNDAIVD